MPALNVRGAELAIFNRPVGDVDRPMRKGRHFWIVRYEDYGDAFGVQRLEHLQNLNARPRIEIARRLIGQQQRRMVDQRPRNGHALLLAAGHLRRHVLATLRKPHSLQQAPRQQAGILHARAANRVIQGHDYVLHRRGAREKIEVLENESQLRRPYQRSLVRRQAAHLLAVEPIATRAWPVQAAKDIHQRGLAGTRSAISATISPRAIVRDTPLRTGTSTSPKT